MMKGAVIGKLASLRARQLPQCQSKAPRLRGATGDYERDAGHGWVRPYPDGGRGAGAGKSVVR